MTDAPARRRGPLRVAALSLLPLLVILVLTEVALIALGVAPRQLLQHRSRGFDPTGEYLRPVDGRPGTYATRLFDGLRNVSIPPKDGALRVVMLGGSNTQVMPESALEQALRRGDARGRPWQVVNLGREGYGSERVEILARQAALLEPDVLVVYAGHNEWVEAEYREALAHELGMDPADAREGLLHAFRLWRVITGALRPGSVDWTRVDGTLDGDGDRVGDRVPTEAETRAVVERFGERLRTIARRAQEQGALVVVCTPVTNLFDPPWLWALPDDPELVADTGRLQNAARRLLPERCLDGFHPPLRLRLSSWYTGTPDPSAVAPEPRLLLGAPSGRPATQGLKAASVPGAHWPDPTRWSAPVWRLMTAYDELIDRDLGAEERADVRRARELLEQAARRSPDHARVAFDLGLARWLDGDGVAAREALVRATSLDRASHKATDDIQREVRAVAADVPGVVLVDPAERFAADCRDGLVGYELLMDRCHLQPGARHALMAMVGDAVLAAFDR